jgi:anti-sigma regulatory factor (Ser/Thr protein kinase)
MAATELLRTNLPALPASVRTARHAVKTRLRDEGLDELTDVATLLTSELATNAVRHARTEFALAIERDGPRVRVQVADGSADTPRAGPTARADSADAADGTRTGDAPNAPGGLGLAVVTALSSRWGFEQRRGDGKVVWFELAAAS